LSSLYVATHKNAIINKGLNEDYHCSKCSTKEVIEFNVGDGNSNDNKQEENRQQRQQ